MYRGRKLRTRFTLGKFLLGKISIVKNLTARQNQIVKNLTNYHFVRILTIPNFYTKKLDRTTNRKQAASYPIQSTPMNGGKGIFNLPYYTTTHHAKCQVLFSVH